MGFLFPLFLIAGLVLIVPILIHLFNLRKYKHVLYPNTRFLQQLQIASKKSAQLQKKWLLLTRLLFLAALILAFAKPYIGNNINANKSKRIQVIYIDNSLSMLAKNGQETLLQQEKNKAIQLIESSDKDARFLIWNNDKMMAMQALDKKLAKEEVTSIKPSSFVVDVNKIVINLLASQENEPNELWSVYLFSDFQKSTFLAKNHLQEIKNTQFNLIPFQAKNLTNLSIDTAYFVDNNQIDNQENKLIVRVKKSGDLDEKNSSNLRVQIGQQTKAVAKISTFNAQQIWSDTLTVSLATGWQKVELTLNDYPLTFDDTFRMTIQPVANLSVLVIGDNAIEPHLQAALNSYKGFQQQWKSSASINSTTDLAPYSLIILQNLDNLSNDLVGLIKTKLADGGSVLLFPGKSADKSALNNELKNIATISFGALDTSKQIVSGIQEHHPILTDLFSQIPQNIQLPSVSKRFPIQAGFNANQQAIMNFKDGTPFLAQYSIEKGKLFVLSSPLDVQASDFPLSYFFVPILYKMAIQSQGLLPAAISLGNQNPIWLKSSSDKNNRSVWHLKANNYDAVPVQKPSGSGIDLYLGQLQSVHPGFYKLQQDDGADSVLIAINANRSESEIEYASEKEIIQNLKPIEINWINEDDLNQKGWQNQNSSFPLWKICVLIALLCLAAETYLLLNGRKVKEVKKE